MADLFQADALDDEQLDFVTKEYFAGHKRYKNNDSLLTELKRFDALDNALKHPNNISLCRDLLREYELPKRLEEQSEQDYQAEIEKKEGFPLKHFIDDVQSVYCADNRPWVIGYSGGKDSSAVVSLIYLALLALDKSKRTKHVYIVASDTLVETPVVVDHINRSLEAIGNQAKLDSLPITTHKVLPKADQTFWACLLGKGYPAPTQSFRWCTERMKIDPVSNFIKDKVSTHDEVIVVLGSRSQESASRAQVIAKHKIENTRLARHTTLANAFIYTPIDTWSMDDVWKLLRACSLEVTISPMGIGKKWINSYDLEWQNPWGVKNLTLWNLYKDSSDQGECPMVIDDSTPSCGNSRFGCWTCTVVTKDRAMESLIQNGEEWMRPLLDFRNKLASTNIPDNKQIYRNFKRRTGRVSYQRVKEGQELADEREHVPGPYLLKYRKEWIKELLVQQKQFNSSGYQIELITEPELHAIRQEWLNDPNEPDWADSLPKIYREVFDRDLSWVINDNSSFGETEALILRELSENYQVAPEMVQKLLDLELSLEGLSRRAGVFEKLGTLLRQDWGTLEEIKEKHASLQSKAEFDVHKDQISIYEQAIAELDKQAKVEL